MTKATLTFDISDPDDRMEHLAAVKSRDMAIVLWDISHNLKKECHQQVEGCIEKLFNNYDTIEMVFEKIRDLLNETNIVPDELTI